MSASGYENECFFVTPIGFEDSPERKQADLVERFLVGVAAERLGLTVQRADALTEPGQISHQVIDHVFNAKAVVADLSGSNANVYYELALRHAARKPVVLIAHKNHMPNLAFDTAAERTIPYDHNDLESVDEAKNAVEAMLRAGLDGVVKSPVATALNLQQLESGDAEEQTLAEVMALLGDLQSGQRRLTREIELLSLRRGSGRSNAREAAERALDTYRGNRLP